MVKCLFVKVKCALRWLETKYNSIWLRSTYPKKCAMELQAPRVTFEDAIFNEQRDTPLPIMECL